MGVTDHLITLLCNPSVYEHEVSDISVIETHISWIILTGDYAYKIKKPIHFSFVDFSTLEKRQFYCHEEMRLNSRLAPDLYLSIVDITGDPENPSFKNTGKTIEFAVKMRQFSQKSMLSYLSAQNLLRKQHIKDMVNEIAKFHLQIDRVSAEGIIGTPDNIHYWAKDNFEQIESKLEDQEDLAVLKVIKGWVEREYSKRYIQFHQRRNLGFVRECHGDMHLGNMVLIEDKVTIFDCIDFNEQLRWIDVISEVAFVVMDLHERKHSDYAYQFMSWYLQHTGDYKGFIVFPYYFVYRAIVRAKVAMLRMAQSSITDIQKKTIQKEFKLYIELAENYIKKRKATLVITYGLSGSGKSTYSELLVGPLGAIQIRSDIERKRLYGYSAAENTTSGTDKNIYSKQSSKETYEYLAIIAEHVISSGHSVIIDACFLHREQRNKFRILASELQVPLIILEFNATVDTLKQRIVARAEDRNEPSEADVDVLNHQLQKSSPLRRDEKMNSIAINTENFVRVDEIITAFNSMI